jgi:hypothetical protein
VGFVLRGGWHQIWGNWRVHRHAKPPPPVWYPVKGKTLTHLLSRLARQSNENTDEMAAPYPVDVSPLRTFSPLASEPPKSFLQDLSPDTPANCLLLGCGDPRNILFSLFYDQKDGIISYMNRLTDRNYCSSCLRYYLL